MRSRLLTNSLAFIVCVFFMVDILNARDFTHDSPLLKEKLNCEQLDDRGICLSKVVIYKEPRAVLYVFDIYLKENTVGTSDDSDNVRFREMSDFAYLSMAQTSSWLNPLTAEHLGTEPILVDLVGSGLYTPEEIIVAYNIEQNGKKYTSCLVAKVNHLGGVDLHSRFLLGTKDVYQMLSEDCDDGAQENGLEKQACLLPVK